MRAMILERQGSPLVQQDVRKPRPGAGQVLVKVSVCGVCRTDLHVVDGDLRSPALPLILGHQIVGEVVEIGSDVEDVRVGQRVGIPWLGGTCGVCRYCLSDRENLCDNPKFTGYQLNGGYAEYAVADARFCLPIPDSYDDLHAAPLLCAGLIGYRSLRMAGEGTSLGLYGFGAAAHIVAQVAIFQGRDVYAFVRPGDDAGMDFARGMGAVWAGGSHERPDTDLDAAIIFAPVGALIPAALRAVGKGGRVVCAGIHMSDIPSFEYEALWGERMIVSVANLTRQDGIDFFDVAPRVPVKTTVTPYPLEAANRALDDLREGRVEGAAVLEV
ncbi:MAG TPA: zinc-dependent alcohol dehydrogenase family protein [Rhodothermales bacterium]|nr:zinc-dependent alcohol dehydrogenase family protein [Rhodothermales bacterium]